MICKPGSHHVKKHTRMSKNGKRHIVEAHCRENPESKKSWLEASNLGYLFKHRSKKGYLKLKKIKDFDDHGQYDEMVQFWLDYWVSKNELKFKIDPLLIKAMIAVESSFREKVVTKVVGSSATGLMQVTVSTMKWLSGKPKRDGYVQVSRNQVAINQDEAKIANSNIAVGTRWLAFKIKTSPDRKSKTNKEKLHAGIKFYYGWSPGGQKYLEKVLRVYEKSK